MRVGPASICSHLCERNWPGGCWGTSATLADGTKTLCIGLLDQVFLCRKIPQGG